MAWRFSFSPTPISLLLLSLLSSSWNPCSSNPDSCTIRNEAGVQGMFVFGSSIVDNGNNNYLPTLGKSNYTPYGIDFPLGPTGRFSNGKNVADLLGDLLHLPLLPPFLDPSTKGERILRGVNFGSGGAGILDQTGSITGTVLNLTHQINNFEEVTAPQLEALTGCKATQLLPHYLFFIAAGGNDYQLNYFTSESNGSVKTFTRNLMAAYTHRLERLYKLGARKFVLLAINPIGCGPVARERTLDNSCVEKWNSAARLFNRLLKTTVDCLRARFSGSEFVVVNPYRIITGITRDSASRGFVNVTSACCEVSISGILCKDSGRLCADRSGYAYFDGQHSTEAVSSIIVARAYASDREDEVYPFNVKKLVLL